MCEITSIGLMSAARTTRPGGGAVRDEVGDLRIVFTHSFTPRLRALCLAAGRIFSHAILGLWDCEGVLGVYLSSHL